MVILNKLVVVDVLYSTAENLVLAKIHEIRLPCFSLRSMKFSMQPVRELLKTICSKANKKMPAMFSLCAFQDKQPIDSMTFLNTSFYGASTGRMTFQSILVGWGERLFLTILTSFIISARKVKQIMYSDPSLGGRWPVPVLSARFGHIYNTTDRTIPGRKWSFLDRAFSVQMAEYSKTRE